VRTLQTIISNLDAALNAFQWQCVERLSEQLAKEIRGSRALDIKTVDEVITRLRRKRQFRAIALVVDALLESKVISDVAIRHYAQALIDSGYLFAAEQLLNWLMSLPDVDIDPAEVHGMRGRIDKQRHINQAAARAPRGDDYLVSAVGHYLAGYALNRTENYWHGINAVALLQRAVDDHIEVPNSPVADDMAREIASTLEQSRSNGRLSAWQLATLLEAYVALEENEKAIALVSEYASSERADAFEIGGTLRQLIEVWELSDGIPPGDKLLPLLRAALLKCEGGSVTVDSQSISTTLQMTFSGGGFKTVEWLQAGLRCCESIVRIETKLNEAKGTGWLFHSSELGMDGPDELLLMTNAHVLGPVGQVRPENAAVRFQMSGATSTIGNVVRTSGPEEYDATVVRLNSMPPDTCGLRLSTEPLKVERTGSAPQRLYVIGHPGGGSLQFSLHDSIVLDCNERRVHYRTPTEGGSSGSPVFDENWTVVALHHAGRLRMGRLDTPGCTYEANEGIPMSAIRDFIRQRTP
jgi:hypothetical protein